MAKAPKPAFTLSHPRARLDVYANTMTLIECLGETRAAVLSELHGLRLSPEVVAKLLEASEALKEATRIMEAEGFQALRAERAEDEATGRAVVRSCPHCGRPSATLTSNLCGEALRGRSCTNECGRNEKVLRVQSRGGVLHGAQGAVVLLPNGQWDCGSDA